MTMEFTSPIAPSKHTPPRCPPYFEANTVEDLLPYLDSVARRPYSHGLHSAWGLERGQRVLVYANNWYDPLCLEAIKQTLENHGCEYEIAFTDLGPPPELEGHDEIQLMRTLTDSINTMFEEPQTSILGWSLTDSTFEECLSAVRDQLRDFPDPPKGFLRGIAACPYVEPTAIGSRGGYELEGGAVPSHDAARVTIGPDGSVNASFGTPSIGQGLETTMAQVVADELGVATEVVTVTWGDTNQAPISMTGARASRSAAVSGGALRRAAQKLRERLVRVAAEMLEAAEDDVRFIDGTVSVAGIDGPELTWAQLVAHVFNGNPTALGSESLDATSTYDPVATYSNGAVGAIVDVDEGTGTVVVRALVGAEDCGQAINPMVVEGQFIGGAVQGIGGVLHEEIQYSATGQPITTTLMDYRLPTASDVPRLHVTHVQGSEDPPIKGVGESGTIGASAAVACALADALARRGGEVTRLPMLPYRTWEAMQPSTTSSVP